MATTVFLCPISAIFQWFNDVGIVLAGGKINTYLAGTSTPANTWTDQTGTVLNSNPIVLSANGRMNSVQIWQAQGVALKILITDANNNQLGPVFDQITGINDPTALETIYANPASGSGADLIANAMRSYGLISDVRAANAPTLSGGQTLIIAIEGSSTLNDGLGGLFYWSASSSATDDGINVIKPTSVSSAGRYLRLKISPFGTFTATLTGMSGTVTGTITYRVTLGFMVTLQGSISGTSNATSMTLTGIPAFLIPATLGAAITCLLQDNGVTKGGWGTINTGGVITFGIGIDNNVSGFTNSGTKGLGSGFTFAYPLT